MNAIKRASIGIKHVLEVTLIKCILDAFGNKIYINITKPTKHPKQNKTKREKSTCF